MRRRVCSKRCKAARSRACRCVCGGRTHGLAVSGQQFLFLIDDATVPIPRQLTLRKRKAVKKR